MPPPDMTLLGDGLLVDTKSLTLAIHKVLIRACSSLACLLVASEALITRIRPK